MSEEAPEEGEEERKHCLDAAAADKQTLTLKQP